MSSDLRVEASPYSQASWTRDEVAEVPLLNPWVSSRSGWTWRYSGVPHTKYVIFNTPVETREERGKAPLASRPSMSIAGVIIKYVMHLPSMIHQSYYFYSSSPESKSAIAPLPTLIPPQDVPGPNVLASATESPTKPSILPHRRVKLARLKSDRVLRATSQTHIIPPLLREREVFGVSSTRPNGQ